MTPEEQVADVKSRSFTKANIGIEEMEGGFIVTGTINWYDKITRQHVISQSDRGVAVDVNTAFNMGHKYATTGSFNDAPVAAPVPPPVPVNQVPEAPQPVVGEQPIGGAAIDPLAVAPAPTGGTI